MRTVLHVVGARPNFMKLAPIFRAVASRKELRQRVVHTGQHYDEKMSEVFFRDLGLPAPDLNLGVGSGTHAEQTAKALVELERVFIGERPDLVSVVGDVNSTLAAALAAAKLRIGVSHVEAGLRSFDRSMPEEINRLVVDRLADHLLTPSADADENLRREGVAPARIHRVGNVMIDALYGSLHVARSLRMPAKMGLTGRYAVCTLHRPANVDDPAILSRVLGALEEIARELPVVLAAHPRTRARMDSLGLVPHGLTVIEPLGYLEFLSLTSGAALILTDSGGLQEESTALGIPCLTLRENTERPITVDEGTNTLVGSEPRRIIETARHVLAGEGKRGRVPELWDGRAAERIAELYGRIA
ncbi:MAG TPA: UDP-N-acetylglucosamine 2-epimerase (non-hydrolyzing) [Myxococcales bacterium]|jgi:UDP-N-acetylglucosamine 2-epimerase (non-hydrolysing)